MKRSTFEQFDIIRITTTRNVKWMTDIPGQIPNPNGIWSIICTYPKTGELLIQKDTALVKIPAIDVIKVANFSMNTVFERLEKSVEKYLQKPNKELSNE